MFEKLLNMVRPYFLSRKYEHAKMLVEEIVGNITVSYNRKKKI